MSNADQQVSEIKARIDAAQRTVARAEADRDAARKAANTALRDLTAEFGVSTVAEAKAKMEELQSELDGLIAQTRQSLDELNL